MTIIGQDNRIEITNFNEDPFDSVVTVDSVANSDFDAGEGVDGAEGSGILISPNHILTAAHVIDNMQAARITAAEDVLDLPTRTTTQFPLNNANANIRNGGALSKDIRYNGEVGDGYDVGLITLSDGESLSDPSKYIGLLAFVDPKDALGYTVTTAGYPALVRNAKIDISKNAQYILRDENGNPLIKSVKNLASNDLFNSVSTAAQVLFSATGTVNEVLNNGDLGLSDTIDIEVGHSGSGVWTTLEGDEPRVMGVMSRQKTGLSSVGVPLFQYNFAASIDADAYSRIIEKMKNRLEVDSGNDLPENAIIGSNPRLLGLISGNDQIVGTYRRERILGRKGNDILSGEGADDRLEGNEGDDTLKGHEGNDSLVGGDGNDLLQGGKNEDQLNGNAGSDRIFGDLGNDLLRGEGENDYISGGDGNDTVKGGTGNDSIAGGNGLDTLQGGDGNDNLNGNGGSDRIFGDLGNDLLRGEGENDYLSGGDGNDTLKGQSGIDYLTGGKGLDLLQGGDGNDNLNGDGESDRVFGDLGNDLIQGGTGNDYLSGGNGFDTLTGGFGRDTLAGGVGQDSFWFERVDQLVDEVTDFNVEDDTLLFTASNFAGVSKGIINPEIFTIGASARDSSDRFIYNAGSGDLFYDSDGIGSSLQIKLAQLDSNLSLTHNNFQIV